MLVVGSGLTGAVIARTAADAGRSVQVLERRDHVGGNVWDHLHPSGIRVHTYGPHYFRTNNERLWSFVHRFADFAPYHAELASLVDGRYERWPVTTEYIERTVGPHWKPAHEGPAANFEEASLAMMPEVVYRKFVKGYTEKQWGVPADALSADLAGRFEVREGDDFRLKRHRFQGIPSAGYASFMTAMLDGIPVELDTDYLRDRDRYPARRGVVFTGPIDEYYGFDLGPLAYRGQHRQHEYLPDMDVAQPFGQVNNPDPTDGPHVRTLEWKHMMPNADRAAAKGTVLTREVPCTPTRTDAFEYPFPDDANRRLYERYRARAKHQAGLLICGRLGEYRYYDMDQAIARALLLAKRVVAW